jgi:hypothetical protein
MKMKTQIINGTMLRENNRRSDETEPKDIQYRRSIIKVWQYTWIEPKTGIKNHSRKYFRDQNLPKFL